MFAIFNPPRGKGAKYGRKSKPGKKSSSRKAKTPYQKFVSRYFSSHPGAKMAEAGRAWSSGEGKIRAHKKARAKVHRGAGKKYVLRSTVPSIVSSALKANVCNVSALQRARAKYCGTGAKSGMSAFIEKFRGASTLAGDRLRSAAEMGYRAVANNKGKKMSRRKGRSKGIFGSSFNVGQYLNANPPQLAGRYSGALSGVQPKNISGAVPVLAGYAANALLTSFAGSKLPYAKAGAGSYLLGGVGAGLLSALAGQFLGRQIAEGVLAGALVEPMVRVIRDFSKGGVSAIGLKGHFDEGLSDSVEGQSFLGDFTTPGMISAAQPTESSISQYSLPQATQPVQPQQQMVGVDAYEADMVGAVMDSNSGM